MNKNFTCHYFFVSHKNNSFAVISRSKQELQSQKEILKSLFSDHAFSIDRTLTTELPEEIRVVFESDEENVLFKIEHVGTEYQLLTHMAIKNNTFKPETEFELFLKNNNLLNDWIAGKLQGTISSFYKERSREFGRRIRSSESKEVFNDYEKIWKLPEYFDGLINERHGEYANFHYKLVYRLTILCGKSCNTEWLKEAKEDRF